VTCSGVGRPSALWLAMDDAACGSTPWSISSPQVLGHCASQEDLWTTPSSSSVGGEWAWCPRL